MIKNKTAQIGLEYLIVIGFLTFVLIGTLGVALYHNSTFRDVISTRQVENMAHKVLSSSESVYYSGEPSKITMVSYIPGGILEAQIANNTIFITYQTSTGLNKISFPSNVPISGSLSTVSGIREIVLVANDEGVVIST